MRASADVWDVVIVGGGAAGLSAALLLGRCRRRVLVFDDGKPRNAVSPAAHAVFTRDGESPAELCRVAREQLAPYDVAVRNATIVRAWRDGRAFVVAAEDGAEFRSKKLLLATGIVDLLPDVPGFDAMYGRSAFHCPYCDAWEVRDRRLTVLARGRPGVEYALGLTTWSDDIVLCTNGPGRLAVADRRKLDVHGIAVRQERILELDHVDGALRRIVFEGAAPLERDALFFQGGTRQRSSLAHDLGCPFTREGKVQTGRLAAIGGGLYVAGDAVREVHFVSVAAAEGLKAAFAINKELREEHSRNLLRAREATAAAHPDRPAAAGPAGWSDT